MSRYTYVIIFPAIAFTAFYFIDFSMKIWVALTGFAILFFLWQRYVMLWLYGKSQFDSDARRGHTLRRIRLDSATSW